MNILGKCTLLCTSNLLTCNHRQVRSVQFLTMYPWFYQSTVSYTDYEMSYNETMTNGLSISNTSLNSSSLILLAQPYKIDQFKDIILQFYDIIISLILQLLKIC